MEREKPSFFVLKKLTVFASLALSAFGDGLRPNIGAYVTRYRGAELKVETAAGNSGMHGAEAAKRWEREGRDEETKPQRSTERHRCHAGR
jgi:hypothetical protein